MSYKILKYELPISDDVIELELPSSNLLLSIKPKGDQIFMWALVRQTETQIRKFKIIGTGHDIENADNLYFLSTAVMPNGLVWHIFEIRE